MHPLLVAVPSRALFAAALAAAGAILARDLLRRRRDPGARLGPGPLHLVAAAYLLLGLRGGSWLPAPEVLLRAWAPVPVYAYGAMLFAAALAGWFVTARLAARDGLARERVASIFLWTALGALVGARGLYVALHPGVFDRLADVLRADRGGIVAYGGMIGGAIASAIACRVRRVPFLAWADAAAPAVVLGTGITRLGCFLAGCDYGRPGTVPWAVRFPAGSPAWRSHVEGLGLPATADASLPVHPAQLYEALAGFALFGALLLLRRRRPFPGVVFLGWVIGYGALRPVIELFRGDPRDGLGPFSTAQLIGLASVVAGGAALALLARLPRPAPSGLRPAPRHPTQSHFHSQRKGLRVGSGAGEGRRRR